MAITRRQALRLSGGSLMLAAASGATRLAVAQPTVAAPTPAERRVMAAAAEGFMRTHGVPGLGVAIARHGVLVYEDAFGVADRETAAPLTTAHRFRIASVSKPITAIAIYTLIERKALAPSDRVLGPGGLLGVVAGDERVGRISVDHLLTHTCGGWSNERRDPMFSMPRLDHAALISWTLANLPLSDEPGTTYSYSNFGYCLLGRVIEKVAGRPYASYVQDAVLSPIGITDMEIAGSTLEERAPGEVRYHGVDGEDPYRFNIRRMDSHGGWIARPAALALIAGNVSGFSRRSVLRPESIRAMTKASAVDSGYARGWSINRHGNWWHTGSLPGTASIMVRTSSGYSWGAIVNTRNRASTLAADLDGLVWTMARKVRGWSA